MGNHPNSVSLSYQIDHITDPLQNAFLRCWSSFGHDERVPTRQELDPLIMGPEGILPHIWIIERLDQSFTFRLMGDSIRSSWGKDLSNQPLDQLFPNSIVQRMFQDWNRVIKDQLLFHSIGRMYPTDERFRETNRISLPLAADANHSEGLVGITLFGPDQKLLGQTEPCTPSVKLEQTTLTPVSILWDKLASETLDS